MNICLYQKHNKSACNIRSTTLHQQSNHLCIGWQVATEWKILMLSAVTCGCTMSKQSTNYDAWKLVLSERNALTARAIKSASKQRKT